MSGERIEEYELGREIGFYEQIDQPLREEEKTKIYFHKCPVVMLGIEFYCPCGCGTLLDVSEYPGTYHRRIVMEDGKFSFTPAIVVSGCGTAFQIFKNKVILR